MDDEGVHRSQGGSKNKAPNPKKRAKIEEKDDDSTRL